MLRHLYVLALGLLELELPDHRDSTTGALRCAIASALPSFFSRPGLAVRPVVGAKRCSAYPAATSTPPAPLRAFDATQPQWQRHRARQEGRLRHWHVHQLSHRLRLAGHGAQRDPVVEVDRGHSDNLLDRGRLVNAGEDLHHVHHLRRKNIESRQRGTASTVLSTVRRRTRSCSPTSDSLSGREPRAAGTSIGKYRVPALWGRDASGTWPCSASRDPPPRHLPFSDLVLRLGKGHCDAQAFAAQELPEPSLPPSSGSRCAANICHDACSLKLFRKVTQTTEKQNGHSCGETAWVVVVVSNACSTVCMSTAVMTMQQSLRPIGVRSPGSPDSRPRHLPSRIKHGKKLLSCNPETEVTPCLMQGADGIMSRCQVP